VLIALRNKIQGCSNLWGHNLKLALAFKILNPGLGYFGRNNTKWYSVPKYWKFLFCCCLLNVFCVELKFIHPIVDNSCLTWFLCQCQEYSQTHTHILNFKLNMILILQFYNFDQTFLKFLFLFLGNFYFDVAWMVLCTGLPCSRFDSLFSILTKIMKNLLSFNCWYFCNIKYRWH